MNLLKKTLSLFLLVTLIGVGGYIWTERAPLLSHYLSDRLKLDITIQELSLSPKHVTMKGIKIYDPSNGNMFQSEKIHLSFSPTILFSSTKTFDSLELSDTTIDVSAIKEISNGVKNIVENGVKWFKKAKNALTHKKQHTHSSANEKLIIESFTASNIKVRFHDPLKQGNLFQLPAIPTIKLHHVTSDREDTIRAIIDVTLQTLVTQVNKPN